MVCNRCIRVVEDGFEKLKMDIVKIELGRVVVTSQLSLDKTEEVRKMLDTNGFELIDDKKSKIIEQIKTLVIEITHYGKKVPTSVNSSDFIAKELGYNYSYLSNLFSSVEDITIEKYIVKQRIEKIKELLVYDELTLTEISHQLGYSSVQHLSNQFKKTTGLTPSHFKKLKKSKRKPLDEV